MLDVLLQPGIYVGIIVLAFVLKRSGLVPDTAFSVTSRVMTNLTLPCAILSTFTAMEVDYSLLAMIAVGICMNLMTLAVGFAASHGRYRSDRGFNMINFSGFNLGCFAMPFMQSFFTPTAVAAAYLVDAGNSIMCTGLNYSIVSSLEGENRPDFRQVIKQLLTTIPFVTYLFALFIWFTGIQIPVFFREFFATAGGANPVIAMVTIGFGMNIRMNRAYIRRICGTVAGHFLGGALIALITVFLLPLPGALKRVVVILCFAPISAMTPIFTERLREDVELSATVNSVSILVSIVAMTVLQNVL
jgi:predicted permease